MGIMTSLKANKAYRAQKAGNGAEAIKLYEECFNEGLNDPRYILAYAILIIRAGEYEKAKAFLVKHQKAPGMTDEQKVNLIVDYAACVYRLGDLDKAIAKLEEIHRSKGPRSIIYQTLGYLYAEKYQEKNKEAFIADVKRKAEEALRAAEQAEKEKAEKAEKAAGETTGETTGEKTAGDKKADAGDEIVPDVKYRKAPASTLSPEEQWEAGKEKILAYNKEAADYDDEDAICWDNLAQTYYRVFGDKETAKPLFEKALALKDGQIDTLYFLSRYDLAAGNKAEALKKLEKAAEGRFSPLNYCTRDEILAEIKALKGE